jgi:hypothetical protein
VELGAEDWKQIASGNLGWAYYQLGDDERALEQFLEAEKSAASSEISATNSNGSVTPGMSITIPAIWPVPRSPIARRSIWQGRSTARKTS